VVCRGFTLRHAHDAGHVLRHAECIVPALGRYLCVNCETIHKEFSWSACCGAVVAAG